MAKFLSTATCAAMIGALAQIAAWGQPASQKIFIEPRSRAPVNETVPAGQPAHLRVEASVVLVPASVTTDMGMRVNGLRRESFRVFEDGVEQPVTYFSMEDAPVSIGLLFDASGSM